MPPDFAVTRPPWRATCSHGRVRDPDADHRATRAARTSSSTWRSISGPTWTVTRRSRTGQGRRRPIRGRVILGAGGPGPLRLPLDRQRRAGRSDLRLDGHQRHRHAGLLRHGRRLEPGPFPIGFDFPFYGNTVRRLPGVLQRLPELHEHVDATYSNQALPSTGAPENLLALLLGRPADRHRAPAPTSTTTTTAPG